MAVDMKLFCASLVFILLAVSSLRAADDETPFFESIVPLSELVRKGIISDSQAELIRTGAIGIEPTVRATDSKEQITISGYVQFYYTYAAGHDDALPNPPSRSEFVTQNLILGINAKLYEEWHAVINANFADGFANRNYLDSTYIRKFWPDVGAFYMGYKKARFGLEQYTSSRTIPAVQRSIATNYFTGTYDRLGAGLFAPSLAGVGTTSLGLGSRRVGVFWSGMAPYIDGLTYYAEVTQSYQDFEAPPNTGSRNQLGYSGGIQYNFDAEHGPALVDHFDISLGVNATYQPDGNSLEITTPAGTFSQNNSIVGIDPFVQLEYHNFHFIGEFMAAIVERGRATGDNGPLSITGYNTPNAVPVGGNAYASYLIADTIEPVFRFSFVDSDGAGISPGVVSNGTSFGGPVPGGPPVPRFNLAPVGTGFFDQAQSYYFGFNWYILGNDVKVSAGYERIEFQNRWDTTGFGGPNASEDVVRIRTQVVF